MEGTNKFRSFFSGVFGFVNAVIPEKENKGQGVYSYGIDNRLPNNLLAWVNESGIARRCVSKIGTYISANGFTSDEAKTFIIGKEKANDLLEFIGIQCAYFNGFALYVKRDGTGKVISLQHVPFQCVRKALPPNDEKKKGVQSTAYRPQYEVNLTYGQPKFDRAASKFYPEFRGELTEAQFAQVYNEIAEGEIIYAYLPAPDNSQYPNPEYYAQIEDIRTASELAKFDYETVTNGFITSAILTYTGVLDNTEKDEYGKTEQDYFVDGLKNFTGQEKDKNGVSGRNKLLVLNAQTNEQMPQLQPFDSKAIFEASNSKRDLIDRSICRIFGVHPVLVGFSDASVLGNTQAIANASMELNKNVQPYQNLVSKTFKKIWPAIDWTLSEYTPVQYVDPALLPDMTEDERRGILLNLPKIERPVPSEGERILGILNNLSPLLATKVIDLIPKDTLLKALGLPVEQQTTTTNEPSQTN